MTRPEGRERYARVCGGRGRDYRGADDGTLPAGRELRLLACLAGVVLLALAPIGSSLERLCLNLHRFLGNPTIRIAPPWVAPRTTAECFNVAFFVQFGLTLAWWLGDRWVMPIAVLLSLTIEILQHVLWPGLDGSTTSPATVIGASLGVVVAVLRSARAPVEVQESNGPRRRRQSRRGTAPR